MGVCLLTDIWPIGDHQQLFFLIFIWLPWILVAAHGIFDLCFGVQDLLFQLGTWDLVLGPGIDPGPLHWEKGGLATGPPGKCPTTSSFAAVSPPASPKAGHEFQSRHQWYPQNIFVFTTWKYDFPMVQVLGISNAFPNQLIKNTSQLSVTHKNNARNRGLRDGGGKNCLMTHVDSLLQLLYHLILTEIIWIDKPPKVPVLPMWQEVNDLLRLSSPKRWVIEPGFQFQIFWLQILCSFLNSLASLSATEQSYKFI